MFRKLCACLYAFRNIGKSNPISIVDQIICPLGHFTLMIFVVGRTLSSWEDTTMKFPMHPESATAEFSCSIYFLIFVVGVQERLLHINVFLIPL